MDDAIEVAVATGSGIAMAQAVGTIDAERGAHGVVVTGRNAERGQKVRAGLEAMGARALFVPAALENLAQVRGSFYDTFDQPDEWVPDNAYRSCGRQIG